MNVHEGERFPNMSLECLLYPIQYLFLAPHISVPIDSSDSRQDNNRTALPLSFSPPLLLPSPRSTTQGWRDGNREIKGGWTRGRRNWPLCYFLFPESLRWGTKMEGENEQMKEEDAGRWKQMSKKDEDNEQMRKIKGFLFFGGGGGMVETRQRCFQREKTRGVKRQKMAGEVMERAEGGC